MIRRDYIIRLIEECAELLRKIVGLQKEQQYQLALTETNRLVAKLISGDVDTLLSWDESRLQMELMRDGGFEARDKAILLAAGLHQAGQIFQAQGAADPARRCQLKALHLLLMQALQNDDSQFPDFIPKLEQITAELHPSELPPATWIGLMHYHERFGFYAAAAADLAALLDLTGDDDELRQLAKVFYGRLLMKSNDELEAGGISRPEIETRLAELEHPSG